MTTLWAASWVDLFSLYLALLKQLLPVVALCVLISCLDDALIDGFYALRWLRGQRWDARQGRPVLTAYDMARKPADWMVIFVPALREANVIGPMLRHALRTLDYPRYLILVGTYPDDPETQAAVRAVAAEDRRVLCVVGDKPSTGSSKAANLNVLYRAMLSLEAQGHPPFKAVVLHDAEDVIHPLELQVFNWHIPAKALVQLPVLPLPHKGARWWQRWMAHTYLEEFAVAHSRDMVVRNWLGASLPSAGVGCGLSRAAIAEAARQNQGLPFRPSAKTEDYELGIKLGLSGFPALMAHVPASPLNPACVATRGHFPSSFATAVRQRSRWLLGISLDGWRRIGWPERWIDRYMLLRDRKALPCAWLNLMTLLLTVQLLALWLLSKLPFWPPFPPLVEANSLTASLLACNLVLLLWRAALRVYITSRYFGWREGLETLPRSISAILIHAAAATLALRDDLKQAITRRPAPWRKTVHTFSPSN